MNKILRIVNISFGLWYEKTTFNVKTFNVKKYAQIQRSLAKCSVESTAVEFSTKF